VKAVSRPIRVLANTIEVVNLLAERGPLTPSEISDAVGIPRSSVYRLAEGLREIGLVESRDDSPVELSKRWLVLADMALAGLREWAGANKILSEVAEATGQTAYLTVPRGEEAVCIDWAQGAGIGLLILKPGLSLPLHAGAAGRVILAFGEKDRQDYLRQSTFPEFTLKTLTTREQLEKDMDSSKSKGFVHSDEDVTLGIGAIGVPIFGDDGEFRGCLSCAGFAADVAAESMEYVQVLREAAGRFSSARA
jgi:IclR family transcriptional regulator, acetate operon repressor